MSDDNSSYSVVIIVALLVGAFVGCAYLGMVFAPAVAHILNKIVTP